MTGHYRFRPRPGVDVLVWRASVLRPERKRGSVRLALVGLLLPLALGVTLVTPDELRRAQAERDAANAGAPPAEVAPCPDGRVGEVPFECYDPSDGCDPGYENDCPYDVDCFERVCAEGAAR